MASHEFIILDRYISGLIAWIYILILPFVACFPAIKPVTDILLKVVQFPLVAGKNIRDGTMDVSLDSGASSD